MNKDIILNELDAELERIINLKKINEINRLGVLFNTEINNYYYDTGTGKTVLMDDKINSIMRYLFDENSTIENTKDFISLFDRDTLIEFLETIKAENLMSAVKPTKLHTYNHCIDIENKIGNELEQVILELTGKCNLRCGYCIYNDDYEFNRSFNSSDMTLDIAKATVDYLKKHSKKDVAVTFYGGEPLIKFDLLKWTIEYSREVLADRELSFSLTTNLTLVTEDIAQYLASVPNMHIVCSLDGPEYVQNSYRKYINGSGSFNEALRGLKLLSKYFKNSKGTLSINGVFAPPFNYEKIEDINNFFESMDFLPDNCAIDVAYASEGTVEIEDHLNELRSNPKYMNNIINDLNPLWVWQYEQVKKSNSINSEKNSIYSSPIQSSLIKIHNRFITDESNGIYPFNGCCVPGARRLYVSTSGDLYVCERIGNSPSIGNIFDGIDIEKVKKYYVDDYAKKSIDYCANCWAIKLCPLCYADRYTEDGFNIDLNETRCIDQRVGVKRELGLYHSILESNPEKLTFLKDMKMY